MEKINFLSFERVCVCLCVIKRGKRTFANEVLREKKNSEAENGIDVSTVKIELSDENGLTYRIENRDTEFKEINLREYIFRYR